LGNGGDGLGIHRYKRFNSKKKQNCKEKSVVNKTYLLTKNASGFFSRNFFLNLLIPIWGRKSMSSGKLSFNLSLYIVLWSFTNSLYPSSRTNYAWK